MYDQYRLPDSDIPLYIYGVVIILIDTGGGCAWGSPIL